MKHPILILMFAAAVACAQVSCSLTDDSSTDVVVPVETMPEAQVDATPEVTAQEDEDTVFRRLVAMNSLRRVESHIRRGEHEKARRGALEAARHASNDPVVKAEIERLMREFGLQVWYTTSLASEMFRRERLKDEIALERIRYGLEQARTALSAKNLDAATDALHEARAIARLAHISNQAIQGELDDVARSIADVR